MTQPLLLRGRPVVVEKTKQVTAKVKQLERNGLHPHLKIVRIEGIKACESYSRAAQRVMTKVGGRASEALFPKDVTEEELIKEVRELNQDPDIHGIIMMQPLPDHICRQKVADQMDPLKDVDGMTTLNLGRLMEGNPQAMIPSTAKAVLEIIDYYEIDVTGLDVCVIGKSNTVGKPLNLLLLNRDATVTNCHRATQNLKKYTCTADIIVTATGAVDLITKDHIAPGAVVIDVGYNFKEGKVVGDVSFDEVAQVAGAITPVPGGVGSVTTISLIEQVVRSCMLQNGVKSHED